MHKSLELGLNIMYTYKVAGQFGAQCAFRSGLHEYSADVRGCDTPGRFATESATEIFTELVY